MGLKANLPIMKSLRFFMNSALIVQLFQCDAAQSLDLARTFFLQAQDDFVPLLSGNLSSYTRELGPHGVLDRRQRQCVNPGYGNSLLIFKFLNDSEG
jgi:hypothetical protein